MDPTPILDVQQLQVRYPRFTLGPVSCAIQPGEMVALLGANAAGKTTFLRAITGRLPAHEGRALVAGRELRRAPPAWRAKVGFAGESPLADPVLRVREWLDFLADIHPGWRQDDVTELLPRLGIDPAAKIGTLSRGTQVKLAFICAEAYRPSLLVLDEPTNGLDPVVRQDFVAVLRERFAGVADRALLFSSHLLEDVEALCDRALLIRDGQLVGEVGGEQLRAARAAGRLTALVADVLGASPPP